MKNIKFIWIKRDIIREFSYIHDRHHNLWEFHFKCRATVAPTFSLLFFLSRYTIYIYIASQNLHTAIPNSPLQSVKTGKKKWMHVNLFPQTKGRKKKKKIYWSKKKKNSHSFILGFLLFPWKRNMGELWRALESRVRDRVRK